MRVVDKNSRAYLFVPYIALMLLYLKVSLFRYVATALLVLPLIICIVINRAIPRRHLLIIAFLAAHFCMAAHTASIASSVKIVLQDLIWIAPIFIYDVIEAIDDNRRKSICGFIFKLMSLILAYCMVRSFLYALSNPYAIRSMANYDVTETPVGMPLAIGGGYPLIFSCIILAPYFIYLGKMHWKTNKKIATISVGAFVFTMMLLVASNVTTAVLLAAAASAWMLVVNRKSNNMIILAVVLVLLAVIVTNPQLLARIIKMVSNIFDTKSIIYIRLQEILPALSGANSSSAFGDRFMLAERSWSTIWDCPFLGAGFQVGYNYDALTNYVGHHSEWLDFLATYGIFIGGLFLVFLYRSIKTLLNASWLKENKAIYTVLFIIFGVIGIMDPVLSTNALLILFVYIPCAECAIGGMNNEKNSVCDL